MKALFCHDGPLSRDEYNNYYGVAHNNESFKRYYLISQELAVAIRVTNTTQKSAEKKLSKITISPFEVVECPSMSSLKGSILNRNKAKKILEKAVKQSDIIIARLPSINGFLAIDLAKKHKKPYLTEVVACPWDAYWNHSVIGKAVAPLMYYATKKRVKESSHVIYVTNEFLQNRYPTYGETANCSNVILNEFDESILNNRLDRFLNRNKNEKLVIGTTAAVNVRYKGQQYIIAALGKLKKAGYTNFEYQLVGGGDQSFLKSIAKKNGVSEQIKFLGSMPHNEVFDWLKTIDIYAQPSRQEGLPRALIEAMSQGLPSFGAKTAGIPELLEPDFIFSNSKSNLNEICTIITTLTTSKMIHQAKRNFKEAQKYENKIIDDRRNEFLNKFFVYSKNFK